ncbi:hypothetical protein FDJ32_gp04 [Pseudomonas phage NV1]|uniref:Uncharacterized protein n=1 Tax=Pseudomonas phage NV1 TaxID=2079543 RepID=A0A2L0HPJ3_9CAUD|nr:hypothetical protein FDJ32_gp04 [Pseudomonas phage NV1]AUX83633.1 hypothetical protein NV1_p04 [Pseudomonas phage NV1]
MVRDTVTGPYVRAVKKKATGAVWVSKVPGVWKKVEYGHKFHRTQVVGYVTTQFDPNTPRNERRFVEVLVKPHWLKM